MDCDLDSKVLSTELNSFIGVPNSMCSINWRNPPSHRIHRRSLTFENSFQVSRNYKLGYLMNSIRSCSIDQLAFSCDAVDSNIRPLSISRVQSSAHVCGKSHVLYYYMSHGAFDWNPALTIAAF